jgi:hypothetical protein
MDFTQAFGTVDIGKSATKEIEAVGTDNRKHKKTIIKGARLKLYPAGFRIYRCSRGIVQPVVFECTEAEAMKLVANQTMTYESTMRLSDNGVTVNTIHYRQYNKKPNKNRKSSNTGHDEQDTAPV